MTTIAIIDSGIGGLSILRQLCDSQHKPTINHSFFLNTTPSKTNQCPNYAAKETDYSDAKFFYLADSAFFPYGSKESDEIQDRLYKICQWLSNKHTPDIIIIACNTAISAIHHHIPAWSRELKVQILEIIGPTISHIVNFKSLLVIGTSLTIKNKVYNFFLEKESKERNRLLDDSTINNNTYTEAQLLKSIAMPGLAEKIENSENCRELLKRQFSTFFCNQHLELDTNNSPEALIVGCTHYSFILHEIRKIIDSFGYSNTLIIDPAHYITEQVRLTLYRDKASRNATIVTIDDKKNMKDANNVNSIMCKTTPAINTKKIYAKKLTYYTTGNLEPAVNNIKKFFSENSKVKLEQAIIS